MDALGLPVRVKVTPAHRAGSPQAEGLIWNTATSFKAFVDLASAMAGIA